MRPTDRPTHVYGYTEDASTIHCHRFTVTVPSKGYMRPVKYLDTDTLRGIAPKIGNTYYFADGHVVARTVPIKGGRPKNPEKKVTRSYAISQAMAQRLDSESQETGESKSAFVEAALQLLFGES